MADLPCIKCGERLDNDELHYQEVPYAEALKAYQTHGCEGVGYTCNPVPAYGEDSAMVAAAMYDLLGDDIDCMDDVMDMARDFGLDVA